MSKEWFLRLIQAAAITVTLAAVFQELEKPREERHWHGKLGFIPYDFRFPTVERLREAYWNPDSDRIFTPEVWGIGWGINLYALLEKMRVIGESYLSEDDFLMPTPSLKKVLEDRPVIG
ncbi:MAG TPA: hypothetical protein VJ377_08000 [Dehalococcoidales bacterium]|nr:hypothetical protein [Dehalococcoidales bacterium]